MRRGIGFGFCLVGFAALILSGILAAVHVVGTDAELYHALQMDAGILDFAGVSEETLVRLDECLAAYLKGESDSLEMTVEVFGKEQQAFNARELIHMEDCGRLFVLLRRVLWTAVLGGLALAVAGIFMVRDVRRVRLAGWLAPAALLVPLGAFAAWAALDFNAAFNFFHEVLFANDLWLLDPRTDLLIRICPQSMFMNMGLRIGVIGLAWALGLPLLVALAAWLVHFFKRENTEASR